MAKFFKKECCDHPYRFIIGFFIIYVLFYVVLETLNLPVVWHIECSLDNYIPFVKYAVLPYCAWFLWLAVAMFHMVWKEDGETRWRTLAPMFGGLLLIQLFCLLVPNGIDLRPSEIQGNDLCAIAVRLIEGTDNPNNVCPSMHVYSTIFLDLGVQRGKNHRSRFVKPAAHVLDVLICLSTMLLKQHSIVDVTCALIMAFAMDRLAAYRIAHRTEKETVRV